MSNSITAAQLAAREQIREHDLAALRQIQDALHPRNHPDLNHIVPSILSSLPVVVSELPIESSTKIDCGLRFSRLFPEAQIESTFESTWGETKRELQWPRGLRKYRTWSEMWKDANDYPMTLKYKLETLPPLANDQLARTAYLSRFKSTLFGQSVWSYGVKDLRLTRYDKKSLSHGQVEGEHANGVLWGERGILSQKADNLDPKPHLSIILSHPATFSEGLLRSEILAIVTLMKRQMTNPRWSEHRLIPVFVYTFNGPCARITQAVFNNQCLQIRQSVGMNIQCREGNLDNLKLLVQWMLAEPCGDTSWPTPMIDENKMSINSEPPPNEFVQITVCS